MSASPQYTKKERFLNWLHYNKLYVIAAAVVLWILGSVLWNLLGIGQIQPDYTIAYVGALELPQACVEALEKELAAFGEDLNGDGNVTVQLIQYATGSGSDDNAMYSYAANVTLLADITEGTSYLFLVEQPQAMMDAYQIFACADGTPPDDEDYSIDSKVFSWSDCPVLTALDLGTYEETYLNQVETGDCQSLLSNLYIGRRYYYNEEDVEHLDAYAVFWQRLTAGAAEN